MSAFIEMPRLATLTINSSLLLFTTIVNLFFSFCLMFPSDRGQTKQPLTLLLGVIILSCLFYSVSTIVTLFWEWKNHDDYLLHFFITDCTVDLSLVSYEWLSFYYYVQIVPAPFPIFHWVRRNLKTSIYVLLASDILVTVITRLNLYLLSDLVSSPDFAYGPYSLLNSSTWYMTDEYIQLRSLALYPIMLHYGAMVCVSMVSSLSTVRYLHKHMTKLREMRASVSAARLRGQMRVTITGAVQAFFFSVLAIYFVFQYFTAEKSLFYLDIDITFTIMSLFVSGTTVTLGINQNVLRNRIVSLFGAGPETGVISERPDVHNLH